MGKNLFGYRTKNGSMVYIGVRLTSNKYYSLFLFNGLLDMKTGNSWDKITYYGERCKNKGWETMNYDEISALMDAHVLKVA